MNRLLSTATIALVASATIANAMPMTCQIAEKSWPNARGEPMSDDYRLPGTSTPPQFNIDLEARTARFCSLSSFSSTCAAEKFVTASSKERIAFDDGTEMTFGTIVKEGSVVVRAAYTYPIGKTIYKGICTERPNGAKSLFS